MITIYRIKTVVIITLFYINTQISIIAHNVITTKKCYIYFE